MKKVLLTLGVVCLSLIAVHISTAEIDFETAVGIWLFDEGKGGVAEDISGEGSITLFSQVLPFKVYRGHA